MFKSPIQVRKVIETKNPIKREKHQIEIKKYILTSFKRPKWPIRPKLLTKIEEVNKTKRERRIHQESERERERENIMEEVISTTPNYEPFN